MKRRLRKVTGKKWVGGVCAGIAYWLGAPAWVVRLVLTLSALFYFSGALLYLLLWLFMPAWEETPADFDAVAGG